MTDRDDRQAASEELGGGVAASEDAPPVEQGGDEAAHELARMEDRYKRAVADLDNYRKRIGARARGAAGRGAARCAPARLARGRRQRRARVALRARCRRVREGSARCSTRWRRSSRATACERVGAAGEPFDPERHEAVEVRVSDDLPDRTVVDVVRSGFALGGRVLRPALVVVSRRRSARTDGRRVPRLLRRARRAARRERERTSAGRTARSRASTIPTSTRTPDAKDRFEEISEAYEVLRDPDKRARYDRLGPNWKAGRRRVGARRASVAGGVGLDLASTPATSASSSATGEFSDFFSRLFGGSGRGAAPQPAFDGFSLRGADQEAVLELTLEEAAERRVAAAVARRRTRARGRASRPACATASGSGSPAGRTGLGGELRRETSTSAFACCRTGASASRGATSTSICRSLHGRPRSVPPSRCRR